MTTTTDDQQAEKRNASKRPRDAYRTARDKTYSAYETARERAADVTRQASDQIAIYPVGAVIGGLAIGALVGALFPTTKSEEKLLSSTGKRINEAAKVAAQRGIDAGKEQFDEIKSRATQRVGEAVVEAVSGSGKD